MSIKKYVTKIIERLRGRPVFETLPDALVGSPFIDTGSPGACLLGSCGCKTQLPQKSADRYVVISKGDAVGILDTVTGKVAPMISRYVAGYLLPKAEELVYLDYATFEKHGLPSAPDFVVIRNEYNVWGVLNKQTDRVAQFSTEEIARSAQDIIRRKRISFDTYISRPHEQFLEIGAPAQNCSDF